MNTISEAIARERYPGRGIVVGKSEDGAHAFLAYFIMGRSENSRNRVFALEGDGLRTEIHDPTKVTDPSLILYAPIKVFEDQIIITNGAQTDTIYEHLSSGKTFCSALRTWDFEPDAPHYTPRVSALVKRANPFSYTMSLIKSDGGNPEACVRFFYEYASPIAGQGHFVHTYQKDATPLPSFAGEPEPVLLSGDTKSIAESMWASLDEEYKISLFVRSVSLSGGQSETYLFNKLDRRPA